MKRLILTILLATSMAAFAKGKNADLDSDLDALGGNKDLMERANAIDPKNTTRVVQKREVDRDMRLELGLNYGIVAGGDPYVNTNNLGGQLDFHLDPHWSIGGRYYQSGNSLNAEGNKQFDQYNNLRAANPGANIPRPDIDYAKNTWLGTVAFYPFYGKLNLADLAITQFDVYFLAGYGQISLDQGTVPTYTGGIGLAFWLNQHFSMRMEARYQGYKDNFDDGSSRQMDLTVLTLGFGFLL